MSGESVKNLQNSTVKNPNEMKHPSPCGCVSILCEYTTFDRS